MEAAKCGGRSREGNAENVLLEAHRDDVVVANDVLHGAHQEDEGEEAEMGMKMYSSKRTGPMSPSPVMSRRENVAIRDGDSSKRSGRNIMMLLKLKAA